MKILIDWWSANWPELFALSTVVASLGTATHILFHKRDTRSAVAWLGLVWFAPVIGVCLYWLLGINRIRRRARTLYTRHEPLHLSERHAAVPPSAVQLNLPSQCTHLSDLAELTERVTRLPLMAGNEMLPLINGDEAYPAMLSAIREARSSVSLCTYIFGNDRWGRRFRTALRAARARGVNVRVLVDAIGARYSFPSIVWGLRRDRVPVARFMRSLQPWRFRYYNLRNHRKILVVDGRIGFTGGMNIRAGNVLDDASSHPTQDVHFRIRGPVVAELQRAFADDWEFTTGEVLQGPSWFPHLEPAGTTTARGISDGPDEDYDKLRLAILGALACARRTVRIATPYFLPDGELSTALRVAALRGVRVEILIPRENNLRLVQWATAAGLEELLPSGCRIFRSPPPFDHSKLVVVDGGWCLLGSANWDERSLTLNFEFNVECYDSALAAAVEEIFAAKRDAAEELTLSDLARRPFPVRLRDQTFRLLSPYL